MAFNASFANERRRKKEKKEKKKKTGRDSLPVLTAVKIKRYNQNECSRNSFDNICELVVNSDCYP